MKPTLIILAAGMGSRYGSLKQVDAVGPNGETIIDYSVFDALRAGFGKIVFVVRKDIEKDFLEVFGKRFEGKVPYEIVFQELDMLPGGLICPADRVKPWGTAHAVWVCRDVVKEPFAVINADDFYGQDSFNVLAKKLSDPLLGQNDSFMVGYRLANTLSEQGSVSRGVCKVDTKSFLQDVVERTKIERINGVVKYMDENNAMVPVDEQSLVSMNCWGFTPKLFGHIDSMLNEFLGGSLANPKAEFYIPTVVNHLIKNGKATCNVLPTSSQWFGVTYPGDKPMVMEKLNNLVAKGIYPTPLF
ncbi:MAG: sugar phosphate nucleotidyltransferase [Bacteroidales bacterium]|nr:sugar phosphate nucleotidyltransferase [Bacteroidales bacterium]MDD4384157.1 sugar phosphate nucleotidyltransferase [Bacteroidales bacterium]MDY0197783.1 sugar phosphate nucleotidyltransferase [Tenuifilaceae bacterium]